MVEKKKMCPFIQSNRDDCREEGCGLWNHTQNECALLSISRKI